MTRSSDLKHLSQAELREKVCGLQKQIIQLQGVIDSVPGDIYWKDTEGRWLGVNARGLSSLETMGLASKKDDVLGKTDAQIFGSQAGNTYGANDAEVLQAQEELQFEENIETPDGEQRCQLSVKSPLFDEDHQLVGVVGNTVDISHMKEVESELREAKDIAESASQAQMEFMRNMQHDIRTPFTGILGLAECLLGTETQPDRKDVLQCIIKSATELLAYCNGLMDFSKVRQGAFEQSSKMFEVKKLLDSVIAVEQPTAKLKQLDLRLECEEYLLDRVCGDEFRLYRILVNLVSNAIKFTEKGFVSLKVSVIEIDETHAHLSFSVEDSGVGIPEDKQADVFKPFLRLSESSQGIYGGIGLGLSVVKQFVDEMQGGIELQSSLGQGTTITVTLAFPLEHIRTS